MVNHLAWVGGPRDFGMAQYQYHLISLWKCLCMFSFLLHFTGVIWTGPQTVHKTQMGKHSAQCQLSMEWYTGAEEKWSVRVREAATDKRITPLLSTPGAVTPEQRNTVQKGRTLIFFSPTCSHGLSEAEFALWHTIPLCAVQRHVFSSSSNTASWGVTLPSR